MAIEPEVEPHPQDEDEGGPVKSFLDHLEDLRWVLIKCVVTLSVTMLICLIGGNYVVAVLKHPLEKAQARYGSDEKVAVVRYGETRLGTYSLDLDQWDALVTPPDRTNIWRIETNEIIALAPFVERFKPENKTAPTFFGRIGSALTGWINGPAKPVELSKSIGERLSPETRGLIVDFQKGPKRQGIDHLWFPAPGETERMRSVTTNLMQSLVNDLNRIIESGPLYDEKLFADIPKTLSPNTARGVTNHLQGADLFMLNRRLLLHAYPREITSYGQRYVVAQLEPKSDGKDLVIGVRVDRSPEAEYIAKKMQVDLANLSPAGAFFVAFQVAIYAGIAVSSPLLFYFIAQFVFPALKWNERKYIYRGMFFFVPLFVIGASFCYFILLPVALAASQLYSNWLGFSATLWQAEEYISFVSKFILGMGLGFEMPVVILVLVKIGILNYSILSKGRRYMIVINLILGAVLTTPEVLTQVLMAIPLQVLYEISVWIAWYWERQEKKRVAAEEAAEREGRRE